MDTILITGGTGLVGDAIKRIQNNYSYNFIFMSSKDCNLLNYEQTLIYFEKINPTYVIHLAANVGGLFKNMKYKSDMLEDNIYMNMNVIKVCHKLKIKKLISCLSTCIFPDKVNYPINEEKLHDGVPHFSNDAYAYAKRLLDIQSKVYREQYNDNFICVIPTNIYGHNDNYNLEDAHVIPALIHKCYLAKMNNKKFIISGSGKPLRQFIYSIDLGKLMMNVLENYEKKENIILSSNVEDEISIKDIALLIAKKMDYDNIEFDTTKEDGQYKKTVDNSKMKRELKNIELTNIEKGLEETINYFIENYDVVRK